MNLRTFGGVVMLLAGTASTQLDVATALGAPGTSIPRGTSQLSKRQLSSWST
jgi:hypothetical protein